MPSEDDAGEYTSLKDTSATSTTTNKPQAGDGSEATLLKSSDSEGSTSGSESAIGALYARIARLSKNSKDEEDGGGSTVTIEVKGNGKPPSPGWKTTTKPRPPDPSTKPKVSWIHGNTGGTTPQVEQLNQGGKGLTVPKERTTRSSSDSSAKSEERQRLKETSKEKKNQEGKGTEVNGSPIKHKAHRLGRSREDINHMEHINGVVQNALKKIGNFHNSNSDKKVAEKAAALENPKEPPKSPKVIHPHMNSEAATLLAAQLKEKTQSINRNEGTGLVKTNGLPTPAFRDRGDREKPTPPQKAKRTTPATPGHQGSNKPLLPTTTSLQKMVGVGVPTTDPATPEVAPKSPEKQDLNGSRVGEGGGGAVDVTPKKTPIKKPPRKRGKEGTLDTALETKTPTKTAIMPPQIIK